MIKKNSIDKLAQAILMTSTSLAGTACGSSTPTQTKTISAALRKEQPASMEQPAAKAEPAGKEKKKEKLNCWMVQDDRCRSNFSC